MLCRGDNEPGAHALLQHVEQLDVQQVGVVLASVSDVSQLEGLRIRVRALEGCIQERLDVLKTRHEQAASEKLEETGLDLSLALSAQPHASAPHGSSAGGLDSATPSSSAVTTVPVLVAGTTTTTASWQQAFKQSGNLRADIQNLVHLPQKAAAARHAHTHDHSHSANQVVTNVPYVIPTVRFRYGVCLTTFKALCKKSGMPRWPYRKLKSIDHQ